MTKMSSIDTVKCRNKDAPTVSCSSISEKEKNEQVFHVVYSHTKDILHPCLALNTVQVNVKLYCTHTNAGFLPEEQKVHLHSIKHNV